MIMGGRQGEEEEGREGKECSPQTGRRPSLGDETSQVDIVRSTFLTNWSGLLKLFALLALVSNIYLSDSCSMSLFCGHAHPRLAKWTRWTSDWTNSTLAQPRWPSTKTVHTFSVQCSVSTAGVSR